LKNIFNLSLGLDFRLVLLVLIGLRFCFNYLLSKIPDFDFYGFGFYSYRFAEQRCSFLLPVSYLFDEFRHFFDETGDNFDKASVKRSNF